jgi:uncharacterized phiE125 gp8 family phage protein
MYRPVRIEPPTSLPVSLEEVKAALDIGYVEKDELIKGLIAAAVSYLDGWSGVLGRCLCEQTWRQDFDYFCWDLRLPMFPVLSVESVKYTDVNGAEQTVSPDSYSVLTDGLGTFVRFTKGFSFPTTKAFESAAVRVTYVCGHEDGDDEDPVPAAIKQAIMLLVRLWFDNPSAVVIGATVEKLPFAVDALLAPYRRVRF